MKILFDPDALLEMREASAFYEDNQPGLGKAFLDEVEAAAEEIVRHPLMWRTIKGGSRVCQDELKFDEAAAFVVCAVMIDQTPTTHSNESE